MNNLPSVWMYGGGRQSIRIATLIIEGKIPKPDIACIADTGREQRGTWSYLKEIVQPALGFPIHIVSKEKFATVDLYSGADGESLIIPAFTNINGSVSKLEAFCSNEWKARVCDRWLKKIMSIPKFKPWFGFSVDEPIRFNRKRKALGENVCFPLVDLFPQTKWQCADSVVKFGWPEPKHSCCWMCPLKSDPEWRNTHPDDMAQAIKLDEDIRKKDPNVFLHRSCKPLSEVNFSELISKCGDAPDLFAEKPCDSGVCFV